MQNLYDEIATRLTTYDYQDTVGILPDADPVLMKLPDSGVNVLKGLLADSHLQSLIDQRKKKTLRAEYRWNPGDNSRRAKKILEQFQGDIEEGIGAKTLYDVSSQILDAPYYGYVPIELIYMPVDGRIHLKEIRPLPQHWFGFSAQDNTPKFLSLENPWEGEEVPSNKFLFVQHGPSFENPYGTRLLSRCYWPVEFKRGGMKLWLGFLELFGVPFILGIYPRGMKKEDRAEFLEKLMQMRQRSVAAVPEGSSIEIPKMNSSQQSDLFERFKLAMDKEMSAVILGQASALDIGDQSTMASASVVGASIQELIESDKLLLKSTFDRIAAIYTRLNDAGAKPPVVSFYEEDDPKKETAERDKVLFDTGVSFEPAYYERTYGLEAKDFSLRKKDNEKTEKPGHKKNTEFSEGSTYPVEQRRIDTMVDEMLGSGQAEVNELVDDITRLVEASTDFEGLKENLEKAFPRLMKKEMFADIIARGVLNANMYGRYSA